MLRSHCETKASFKDIKVAKEVISNLSNETAPNLQHFPHSSFNSITEGTPEFKQIHEMFKTMTKI